MKSQYHKLGFMPARFPAAAVSWITNADFLYTMKFRYVAGDDLRQKSTDWGGNRLWRSSNKRQRCTKIKAFRHESGVEKIKLIDGFRGQFSKTIRGENNVFSANYQQLLIINDILSANAIVICRVTRPRHDRTGLAVITAPRHNYETVTSDYLSRTTQYITDHRLKLAASF